MFDEHGMFVPDFLPEADRRGLLKYLARSKRRRYGVGEQAAVVVVDMTRGFVEDRFLSGWAATGIPCAARIRELLEFVRRHPIPVFFTRPIRPTYPVERGSWGKAVPGTPLPGEPAEAYDLYPTLLPAEGEVVFERQKPSAFFGTAFQAMLSYLRVDTLVVTGMVTSGCVRATVNDAFSYNLRPIVPVECVADRSRISHEVELLDMSVKYADVVPLEQLLADLEAYVVRSRVADR